MQMRGWALTMGIGAAAGAVAIMMMPKQSAARRLATKAANKVEEAVCQATDKFQQEMGM